MSIFLFVIELYGSPEGQERFLFIYLFIYWCTFFKLFFHVWHRVIFCFHSFHVSSRVKKKKFHTRKTHFFTQLDTWKKKFDHEREKKVSFHSAHGQKCFNMEKKNLWKEKCFTLDMEENEFYLWRIDSDRRMKKNVSPVKKNIFELEKWDGLPWTWVFFLCLQISKNYTVKNKQILDVSLAGGRGPSLSRRWFWHPRRALWWRAWPVDWERQSQKGVYIGVWVCYIHLQCNT